MVSKEGVICPYCKAKNSKSKAIGIAGLIIPNGGDFSATCDRCGKEFYGTYEVSIIYRTRKEY